VTPTFELLPWQLLLAGFTQLALALFFEGVPQIEWTLELVFLLGYGSVVGTALAYWAMNAVNRGLPASTTSIALLGVPVVGLLSSKIFLSEPVDTILMIATALIIFGIALGATSSASVSRKNSK
jgi:drug/metabolite transporter (DMT)-like permease